MRTSATNKRLRTLLTGIRDEVLIPNPHFQRRLVWSNDHKIAFIETVLAGLPFPEIFISAGSVDRNSGDGTELIVDGQQRITTLYQYFTGSRDLKLGGKVVEYANLSPEDKLEFLEYEVVVRDLGPLGEDETREIFQKINSTNYALNAMEVNNSRFDGMLKKYAEELAQSELFESNRVFTSLDVRRMNDVRFVLTVIISILSGYFNRDEELEPYLERFNDEFPDLNNVRGRIDRVMEFLKECGFESRSRIWQKADLLNAFVEIDRVLNVDGIQINPGKFRAAMNSLFTDVEAVTRDENAPSDASEYYRRVKSGINDRISRINRGLVVRQRIDSANAT